MFNTQRFKDNIFQWDASGYYLYLPATFIYHDIGRMDFYPEVNRLYGCSGNYMEYGLFEQPTGKRVDKYTIGTSLFELPLFLVAHAYCIITGAFPDDGYSIPFQMAGIFSGILWAGWGLLLLGAALRRYFSDGITAFTLLTIAFGTNLYTYCTFLPGMSHPFSFFLVAAALWCVTKNYEGGSSRYIYLAGILMGLIVITRPINVLILPLLLFWGVYDRATLRKKIQFFKDNLVPAMWAGVLFFLVAMVQMSYWKYTSGHWIHYSYEGEGFDFLHPHVWKGLMGFRKGWFIYTPVALVAVARLFFRGGKGCGFLPAIGLFILPMVYVTFSWRCWWYGGGFGARTLIDILPVVAFPLACFYKDVQEGARKRLKSTVALPIMGLFIVLNLFQSYQSSLWILDSERMNTRYYFRIFGKVKVTPEDSKLRMTDEEVSRDWE
jgi:hypothetical protein